MFAVATTSSAARKDGGNDLPLASARLRIPAAALWLKKYRAGTGSVSSTSDNDDTTAPLWNSGVLSVQHSVGEPKPELSQRPEDGTHVPSSSRRQKARDVFEDNPARLELFSDPSELVEEPRLFTCETSAPTRDGKVLARKATNEEVDWAGIVRSEVRDVAKTGNGRKPVGEDRVAVGVNLG